MKIQLHKDKTRKLIVKTKVLFVLHTPPPVHGSSVMGMAIKKSPLINKSFLCSYINLGTSRTVDEIGKKNISKVGRYLKIGFQVLLQINLNKPKLCYFAIASKGLAFYKDSMIALLLKIFGVQLVYHLHNKGIYSHQHKVLDNILYHKVFKNAHVILLSKYLYPDVEKYFTPDQVHFCPNGVSPIKTTSGFNRRTNSDKRHFKQVEILFLSNLIESKGVFILLEACKILYSKGLSFHCTYVGGEGDITAEKFLGKVKEFGLEEIVVYEGKKIGNAKAEFFSHADIFVHPTFEDCFPLVLLEAMQYALPTISTFEGGIPDIVEENKTGLLAQPKNVESLSEKLEILINNPELRKKMGEAGRKKYEQEYTLNKFEVKLKSILKAILNEQ